jgi:hypothetical protein
MSHERKKKDGQDKGKKLRRMREAETRRHERAGPERASTDQPDVVEYKPGAGSDRNRRGSR